MSKGSRRRPGKGYAEKFDSIFGKSLASLDGAPDGEYSAVDGDLWKVSDGQVYWFDSDPLFNRYVAWGEFEAEEFGPFTKKESK